MTPWHCQLGDTSNHRNATMSFQVTLFKAGPKVTPDRFPAHVMMSRDVVAAVKAVMDPGLRLIGFKPRALLRDYHQAGHRCDERHVANLHYYCVSI